MSRRDDRDRASRSTAQASARTNEYFVPKDGIDREVITADICRYLGNDALVRPGNYENPQTRQIQQGYFITAYRNLTTAMIADLKADSERWDAERRATLSSRGPQANGIPVRDSNGMVRKSNTPIVESYRASTTHQSRQYYGPTEAVPPPVNTPSGHSTASSVTMGGQPQEVYGNPGYPPTGGYPQSQSQYGSTPGYSQSEYNNYAVAGSQNPPPFYLGGNLETARRGAQPQQQTGTAVPRSGQPSYPPSSSAGPFEQPYYPASSQQGPSSIAYGQQPQQDSYAYGRGAYNH
ncbi:hypothetical protein BGZ60DRAFT_112535 [Tricladium varicosporioides]|nr:hypothetical protein BGZ60DRAFT_112535 [Hymenoscyphus varicosporioides]